MFAEPGTAMSQCGVNNNNYHNNNVYYASYVRKETEDCKYTESTEVIFHFNATGR